MSIGFTARTTLGTLPLILIAAVAQGWALYGLHIAIDREAWPATHPGALFGMYAIAVFIPPMIQMLAQHARQMAMWLMVAIVGALYGCFGWHFGTQISGDVSNLRNSDDWLPVAFALFVLTLLVLPFVQMRLVTGRWAANYELLFSSAWNNALVLAEAVLFTGLFWLLLLLWGQLFHMLGIDFFKALFSEPIFIYPITSIAFGIALHLIGSLERLTSVVLQQLLSVLKWLALIAGLILALFTIALVMRLPEMIASGDRAISAAWLLWLIAVTVLLVNAAYRDGSVEQPYPRLIALGLRLVLPLTVVIAATALYALYLRIDHHGLTVGRVWASIVAIAACIYALGYAIACKDKQRWMGGISRINVIVAVFLIVAIAAALTPLLSPQRLAANSQFARALQERPAQEAGAEVAMPYRYLRFDAGRYGTARLQELAALQDHPRAEEIRSEATAALSQESREDRTVATHTIDSLVAGLRIFPAGRVLDDALMAELEQELHEPQLVGVVTAGSASGLFVDLNADAVEDFVLLAGPVGAVFQNDSGRWKYVAALNSNEMQRNDHITAALEAGDIQVREPQWRDLLIGRHRYRFVAEHREDAD